MEDIKFVNLTRHQINVFDKGQLLLSLEPTESPARVLTHRAGHQVVGGVPVYTRQDRTLKDLPAPKDGIMYVVSGFVLNHCSDRRDLLAPDTSPNSVIKDDRTGQTLGVKKLVMLNGR